MYTTESLREFADGLARLAEPQSPENVYFRPFRKVILFLSTKRLQHLLILFWPGWKNSRTFWKVSV